MWWKNQPNGADGRNCRKWAVGLLLILPLLVVGPEGAKAGDPSAESEILTAAKASAPDGVLCQKRRCDFHPRLHRVATRYSDIIAEASRAYDVDPALIRAIIHAESGFDPRAVSHQGARGLMQLMPATARSLGVRDRFDPEENVMAGTRYFRELLDKLDGRVKLALAAYNAGLRKVRKYGGVPPFRVTRHYIRNVLHYYDAFQHLSDVAVQQG
jgi:soluble lytic murein transglycosylase-like protein